MVLGGQQGPTPCEIYFDILGIKLRGDYASDLRDKAISNPKFYIGNTC